MKRTEDRLQENKIKIIDGIRKQIFDWIAAIIIVALIMASLGVFGLIDFKTINLAEFFVSWFPYFAAAILLRTDFYKKGIFVGKSTTKFTNVIEDYSKIANSLSGQQIKALYPFCDKYNEDARIAIQEQLLRAEGLYISDFNNYWKDRDGNEYKPLKILDKRTLLALGFTKEQIRAIHNAKKVKVKGINVNFLLSTMNIKDVTRIGDDEATLQKKHIAITVVRYMLTTLLLSILAIRDITDWGWVALVLILFKVSYLFAGSYMSYFRGYDDATVNLVNHFTRKTDILKMYLDYKPEQTSEVIYEMTQKGNNLSQD